MRTEGEPEKLDSPRKMSIKIKVVLAVMWVADGFQDNTDVSRHLAFCVHLACLQDV